MPDGWLLARLRAEDPRLEPDFAFRGTVYWQRAMAILCAQPGHAPADVGMYYAAVGRRPAPNERLDTAAYECLLMSFHHLACLKQLALCHERPYDPVRAAIISWYYAIYNAARAMLFARGSAVPNNHSRVAKQWQSEIANMGLAIRPFDLRVSTLVRRTYLEEVEALRVGSEFDLDHEPGTPDEALGGCCSYLAGTAKREREQKEKEMLASPEFVAEGLRNFRKARAKAMRDERLGRRSVGLLHMAYRYRGKANYRDAIFLSYGADSTPLVRQLLLDLYPVATAFLRMSGAYCRQRVAEGTWVEFTADLRQRCRLAEDVSILEPSA